MLERPTHDHAVTHCHACFLIVRVTCTRAQAHPSLSFFRFCWLNNRKSRVTVRDRGFAVEDLEDSASHYVYVIATLDAGKMVAPVKVGVTRNVVARCATIQTSSAKPLTVFHALGMPSRNAAFGLERSFHVNQDAHRLHGEWFAIAPLRALRLLMLEYVFATLDDQKLGAEAWESLGVECGEDLVPQMIAALDPA